MNELIREALHPYDGLTIVTKVGTRRGPGGEWIHRREPEGLRIPGTSSVAHLRENLAAADLVLPGDAVAELDTIGR